MVGRGCKVVVAEEWSPDISAEMMLKSKRLRRILLLARHVYDGPIFNQAATMVAAGERLDDGGILGINWHVQGINTPLPNMPDCASAHLVSMFIQPDEALTWKTKQPAESA